MMWEWVHTHHDDLQALGPLATIFAALIAVVVTGALGIAQWHIARAQKDIAYDRLKLDLFEKRHSVYKATWSLCLALMPSNKRVPYERFGQWQNTLSEAPFLFPASVVEFTRKVHGLSFDWEQNAEVLESENLDESIRESIIRQQEKIPKEIGRLRIMINAVFEPELSFRQLTRRR
jgi:hypothetical protein